MVIKLFFPLFLLFISFFAAQQSGTVVSDGVPLPGVLVVNIADGTKTTTGTDGKFSIAGISGQELRFVRSGYERQAATVGSGDLYITMVPSAHEIEAVEVPSRRLSGDLGKDSRLFDREDKVARLQSEIGLPPPPEKPREKPADLKKDVLLPILTGNLNVAAIYDIVSGNARRKKNLYRFEDEQEAMNWIIEQAPEDYFDKTGIPAGRRTEFILQSMQKDPQIQKFAKQKNISAALFRLEAFIPEFLKQLNSK